QDCEALGVRGKQVTPAVLDRILALTEGRSMETNIALVENNAKLAAEIAIAFAASS
ncbi:MAG: pseudouridine-5'-phosphate glycosidase, partial [Pseudomonadota bacterium]